MENFLKNCPNCKSTRTVTLYNSKINHSNPYTKFLLEKVVDNERLFNCDMKLCINCLLCFFNYRFSKNELDNYLINKSYFI